MTAYHLHEWVWGQFAKGRPDLHKQWRLRSKKVDAFRTHLIAQCPAIEIAGKITNGTKHFELNKISTGKHRGPFQPGVFQPDVFDVSHLWVERNGRQQRAEDFIAELVEFWKHFFIQYGIK